jgi:hypothetical protein
MPVNKIQKPKSLTAVVDLRLLRRELALSSLRLSLSAPSNPHMNILVPESISCLPLLVGTASVLLRRLIEF